MSASTDESVSPGGIVGCGTVPFNDIQDPLPSNSSTFTSATTSSPASYTHLDINSPRYTSSASMSVDPVEITDSIRPASLVFQSTGLRAENSVAPEARAAHHGFRSMIRRASMSIKTKTRPRRSTLEAHELAEEVTEARPTTASSRWQMFRIATNFRHLRVAPLSSETLPSNSPVAALSMDSHRSEILPSSPQNTAASGSPNGSSESTTSVYMDRAEKMLYRNSRSKHLEEPQGDAESGVGIAITTADEAVATVSYDTEQPLVCTKDFIRDLPVELAIQILSNLDARSLVDAQLVSSTWRHISNNNHVWREAYLRDWTQGYAISQPLKAGSGHGIPITKVDMPWKKIHRARKQLKDNWMQGRAQHIYLTGHLDSIYCVQFDEKKIITGSRDKTIRIWNQLTFRCELIIGPPNVVRERNIMYDGNGEYQHKVPISNGMGVAGYCPPTLSFEMHHNASILCLQYDDEILVTGSSDGTALVHSMKDGYNPIMRLEHHKAAILDLAFDDKHIVTCSKDITVCIWDRKTGAMLKQLRGHAGPVNAVQMQGNTIVSCSGDFKVKLWNIDTGKCIREFTGHTKGLACSQFSEDAKLIASAGNDKMIRIWDANTGECLQKIAAHENLVRSLHIDSVSGRLVSGSYDQDIKVFDVATGRLLLDFPKWHSSWVLGAKSDYRRIISTGQDPKILVMDFGAEVEDIDLLEA